MLKYSAYEYLTQMGWTREKNEGQKSFDTVTLTKNGRFLAK